MAPVAEGASLSTAPALKDDLPALTEPVDALLATQYSTWYPALRRHVPKTTVIDVGAVEPSFLAWLDEDGLVLSTANDGVRRDHARQGALSDSDDGMSEASDTNDAPQFPALNARIREVLDAYGGSVFPKLNWSAPLDAAWIMPGNTLRCQSPNDVYLLLKSSDFAMRDVTQMQELQAACEAHGRPERPRLELVLKKWFDMPRSHEFRCFVRDGRLVAACQRDLTFYEHLQPATTQAQVQTMLHACYDEHIAPNTTLCDLAYDVYLSRHLDRCFVIDVNPYLPRTDPLLWSFNELDAAAAEPAARVPLRVLTSPAQASQALPTYSAHMVPADVVEMSEGQNIAAFAQRWHEELARAAGSSDEDAS